MGESLRMTLVQRMALIYRARTSEVPPWTSGGKNFEILVQFALCTSFDDRLLLWGDVNCFGADWTWINAGLTSLLDSLGIKKTCLITTRSGRQHSRHSDDWHSWLVIQHWRGRRQLHRGPQTGPCQPDRETTCQSRCHLHLQEHSKDHSCLVWVNTTLVFAIHHTNHQNQLVHWSTRQHHHQWTGQGRTTLVVCMAALKLIGKWLSNNFRQAKRCSLY